MTLSFDEWIKREDYGDVEQLRRAFEQGQTVSAAAYDAVKAERDRLQEELDRTQAYNLAEINEFNAGCEAGGQGLDVDEAEAAYRLTLSEGVPNFDTFGCGYAWAVFERQRTALAKINSIRNSIIGLQTMNWSEHIYPLVAALEETGIAGMAYPEACEYYSTMFERTAKAENETIRIKRPSKRSSSLAARP